MLITKEKILKDVKKGLPVMVNFTIAMFLPILSPLSMENLSTTNLIMSELFIFIIFTLPFGCVVGLRNVIDTLHRINLIVEQVLIKHLKNYNHLVILR